MFGKFTDSIERLIQGDADWLENSFRELLQETTISEGPFDRLLGFRPRDLPLKSVWTDSYSQMLRTLHTADSHYMDDQLALELFKNISLLYFKMADEITTPHDLNYLISSYGSVFAVRKVMSFIGQKNYFVLMCRLLTKLTVARREILLVWFDKTPASLLALHNLIRSLQKTIRQNDCLQKQDSAPGILNKLQQIERKNFQTSIFVLESAFMTIRSTLLFCMRETQFHIICTKALQNRRKVVKVHGSLLAVFTLKKYVKATLDLCIKLSTWLTSMAPQDSDEHLKYLKLVQSVFRELCCSQHLSESDVQNYRYRLTQYSRNINRVSVYSLINQIDYEQKLKQTSSAHSFAASAKSSFLDPLSQKHEALKKRLTVLNTCIGQQNMVSKSKLKVSKKTMDNFLTPNKIIMQNYVISNTSSKTATKYNSGVASTQHLTNRSHHAKKLKSKERTSLKTEQSRSSRLSQVKKVISLLTGPLPFCSGTTNNNIKKPGSFDYGLIKDSSSLKVRKIDTDELERQCQTICAIEQQLQFGGYFNQNQTSSINRFEIESPVNKNQGLTQNNRPSIDFKGLNQPESFCPSSFANNNSSNNNRRVRSKPPKNEGSTFKRNSSMRVAKTSKRERQNILAAILGQQGLSINPNSSTFISEEWMFLSKISFSSWHQRQYVRIVSRIVPQAESWALVATFNLGGRSESIRLCSVPKSDKTSQVFNQLVNEFKLKIQTSPLFVQFYNGLGETKYRQELIDSAQLFLSRKRGRPLEEAKLQQCFNLKEYLCSYFKWSIHFKSKPVGDVYHVADQKLKPKDTLKFCKLFEQIILSVNQVSSCTEAVSEIKNKKTLLEVYKHLHCSRSIFYRGFFKNKNHYLFNYINVPEDCLKKLHTLQEIHLVQNTQSFRSLNTLDFECKVIGNSEQKYRKTSRQYETAKHEAITENLFFKKGARLTQKLFFARIFHDIYEYDHQEEDKKIWGSNKGCPDMMSWWQQDRKIVVIEDTHLQTELTERNDLSVNSVRNDEITIIYRDRALKSMIPQVTPRWTYRTYRDFAGLGLCDIACTVQSYSDKRLPLQYFFNCTLRDSRKQYLLTIPEKFLRLRYKDLKEKEVHSLLKCLIDRLVLFRVQYHLHMGMMIPTHQTCQNNLGRSQVRFRKDSYIFVDKVQEVQKFRKPNKVCLGKAVVDRRRVIVFFKYACLEAIEIQVYNRIECTYKVGYLSKKLYSSLISEESSNGLKQINAFKSLIRQGVSLKKEERLQFLGTGLQIQLANLVLNHYKCTPMIDVLRSYTVFLQHVNGQTIYGMYMFDYLRNQDYQPDLLVSSVDKFQQQYSAKVCYSQISQSDLMGMEVDEGLNKIHNKKNQHPERQNSFIRKKIQEDMFVFSKVDPGQMRVDISAITTFCNKEDKEPQKHLRVRTERKGRLFTKTGNQIQDLIVRR